MLVCLPGRFIVLSKRSLAGTVHFLGEEGLRFWFLNIETFNGYGIQPKFSPGAVIFCDASDYAFGSF